MIANSINLQRLRFTHLRAGDLVLWLIASFHVVFAASLLFVLVSLAPAQGAEDVACPGTNLLTALKDSDPEAYAGVIREGAKTPNGRGVLWKIEKDGIEPSWLLGTMHVTDPRVLTMSDAARKALDAASTIVVESDEILDEKKAAAALLLHPELTMFTDGTTIADHLSAEEASRLETGLKKRGISMTAVARMKPWIISSFVALPACELARKAKGASFLDKYIAEDALKSGKQIVGLETFAEQLAAMAELPVEFHLQALIETLALGDKMNDIIETMTQLYLAGDIGLTMPMLKVVAPSEPGEEESGYAAFEKRIVLDRNKVMAKGSAPALAKGNAFIAVGALHLPGEEGLVELLRKQGYTLSAAN